MNFFYYNLCHYCKKLIKIYRRCAGCKSLSYCSEEHQRLDWKDHKMLCRAITISRKNITSKKVYTFNDWRSYRLTCLLSWKRNLQRDLLPFEYQLFMFPRVCGVCYTEDNLRDCIDCRNVSYCSDAHKKQHTLKHRDVCSQLKLCMDVDQYLASGNCYPKVELEAIVQWLDKALDMSQLLTLYNKCDQQSRVETALLTEIISPTVVIYKALKEANVENRDDISIHIVGASNTEATMDWQFMTETIFHTYPNLLTITFILIGPEAWLFSDNLLLCPVCTKSQRKVCLKVLPNLYHEVVDMLDTPGLVVAFNCGLHENQNRDYNEWQQSIPMLVKYDGVPFVFTSYTKDELEKDGNCLKEVGQHLNFLYYGKNHFGTLRPIRDWSVPDMPVFYSHGYMGLVKWTNIT